MLLVIFQVAVILQFIDNNDGIEVRGHGSQMKQRSFVLCNTVVGPSGIL